MFATVGRLSISYRDGSYYHEEPANAFSIEFSIQCGIVGKEVVAIAQLRLLLFSLTVVQEGSKAGGNPNGWAIEPLSKSGIRGSTK